MRIGIDARFYGSMGKGLGRYSQKLIKYLEKIDQNNEYFIFLRKKNWSEFSPKNPKFHKVLADIPWYSWQEHFIMPLKIRRARVDLMHFPHFNVPIFYFGKFVVTIHDLIVSKYPTQRATTLGPLFYFIKRLFYQLVIRLAVWRAKKIIAVSGFTKEDVAKTLKVKADKIVVTYEAADLLSGAVSNVDREEVLKEYNITKSFLLYVGNAYSHKNLEKLIQAFQILLEKYQKDLQLVLVGKLDYFYQRLKKYADKLGLVKDQRVIFAGFVPDDKLDLLYGQGLVYVFPSLYEGFGLPPLEAMTKGLAVVSSSRTCLPEILGEAALYFNPKDVQEMAKVIKKVIDLPDLRRELARKGYEQVKKYSWEKCARATLKVYQNA